MLDESTAASEADQRTRTASAGSAAPDPSKAATTTDRVLRIMTGRVFTAVLAMAAAAMLLLLSREHSWLAPLYVRLPLFLLMVAAYQAVLWLLGRLQNQRNA